MSWRLTASAVTGWLVWASAAYSAPTPGAFELLKRVRQAYADLESYNDLGEIETTTGPTGHGRTSLRFFETAATASGAFLWRTHGETDDGFEERVIWSDGEETFIYSSLHEQYKPVPSLVAELAHALGPGSYEALLVPLLVAGAADVLADPTAAVVEGNEPCGEATCWVISLTRLAGGLESELHVDEQTFMIHEVVARLGGGQPSEPSPRGDLAAASSTPIEIRVRHHLGVPTPPTFTLPPGARQVAAWEPRSAVTDVPVDEPRPISTFTEEITVALFSVAARIVDSRGEPILGLEPEDLIVRVGSAEVPVLGLEWSSSYRPPAEIPKIEPPEILGPRQRSASGKAVPSVSNGRLIVFFLQVDLEPSRIAGHLKILPDVERLMHGLHPDDRVAIVSFDSHLKVWQDFTHSREQAFEVLKRAISYGKPSTDRSQGISLLEHFDHRAATQAATPERALRLTAEALTPLPGEKDLVYLGWGLGRYGAGGVRMTAEYRPTIRALDAARATVFVLDVSQADYHSLEIGLQNVAAHTGGTYDRTLHFASQAVNRLARTIGGHYQVTIDRTAVPEAHGRLMIGLRGQDGRVLFKPLNLG